jgi:hypothetical protein
MHVGRRTSGRNVAGTNWAASPVRGASKAAIIGANVVQRGKMVYAWRRGPAMLALCSDMWEFRKQHAAQAMSGMSQLDRHKVAGAWEEQTR